MRRKEKKTEQLTIIANMNNMYKHLLCLVSSDAAGQYKHIWSDEIKSINQSNSPLNLNYPFFVLSYF
jgi:hypothetical protein